MKVPDVERSSAALEAMEFFPARAKVHIISELGQAIDVLRYRQFKATFGPNSPPVVLDSGGHVRLAKNLQPAARKMGSEPKLWVDFFSSREVHFLYGKEHAQRRRDLAPVFGRGADVWLRDEITLPTLRRRLRELAKNTPEGEVPSADLARFGRHVFVFYAAQLIGLDGVDNDEDAEVLVGILAKIEASLLLVHDKVQADDDELERTLQAVYDARKEYIRRYYEPALERRRLLVAKHKAGEIPETDLPRDLIGHIAMELPSFADPEAGREQATAFLSPSIAGTTVFLIHSLGDLFGWLHKHPEDRQQCSDPAFLYNAISETVRLHQVGVIPRLAMEDVTLSDGMAVKAGEYLAILVGVISRDPDIFGQDSDVYNPRRVVRPGVYRHGLGFGSGAYMCVGLPLVMGQSEMSGSLAPVIKELLDAGIRPDPDSSARKIDQEFTFRELYKSFPVVFDSLTKV